MFGFFKLSSLWYFVIATRTVLQFSRGLLPGHFAEGLRFSKFSVQVMMAGCLCFRTLNTFQLLSILGSWQVLKAITPMAVSKEHRMPGMSCVLEVLIQIRKKKTYSTQEGKMYQGFLLCS